MNTTARQVGGALGVAVLGSVLAASYRSGITPALDRLPPDALPPGARDLAAESIGGTQLLTEMLPVSLGAPVERASVDAFVGAMHTTATISGLVALLGAIVVLRWLPGRTAAPAAATGADLVEAAP